MRDRRFKRKTLQALLVLSLSLRLWILASTAHAAGSCDIFGEMHPLNRVRLSAITETMSSIPRGEPVTLTSNNGNNYPVIFQEAVFDPTHTYVSEVKVLFGAESKLIDLSRIQFVRRANLNVTRFPRKFDPMDSEGLAGRSEDYLVKEQWRSWEGDPHPPQGFKLHVSVDPAQMKELAGFILPLLREKKITHKVATSRDYYESLAKSENGDGGSQAGKFITIYPKSTSEAVEIAREIDQIILAKKLSNHSPHQISGEQPVGKSGMVYARYGKLTGDPEVFWMTHSIARINSQGVIIDGAGQIVRYNGQELTPAALAALPKSQRILLGEALKQSGALVKDQRGNYKPDWMKEDPFQVLR